MVNLENKLRSIQDSISEITKETVTIVAVTKRFSENLYQGCCQAGILHFGENRAQEVRDKAKCLPPNSVLHYLAGIQKNKVKYLQGKVHSFDALDSLETAQLLNQEKIPIKQKLNVLIQVNATEESHKNGINLEKTSLIYELADYCLDSKYLNLEGLMCMGPTPRNDYKAGITTYDNDARSCFAKTANFFIDIQNKLGIELNRLSMGMSDDYKLALAEGSTEIRVGSLLFGPRPKS
jgi:PLP dependent protein